MRRITLTGYTALVLLVTLWPAPPDPYAPGLLRTVLERLHDAGLPAAVDVTFVEAAANVAMFVPLGVLLPPAAVLPRVTRARPWLAAGVLAAFSGLVETVQLLLPQRVPTLQDVVLNTLGGVVGIAALALADRRRRTSPAPAGTSHGRVLKGRAGRVDP